MGVVFYVLAFNELPFWAENKISIIEVIKSTDIKIPEHREVSGDLLSLILKMLDKDPEKRISLAEIRREQWINNGFAVSLDSKEADLMYTDPNKLIRPDALPEDAVDFAKKLAEQMKMGSEIRARDIEVEELKIVDPADDELI